MAMIETSKTLASGSFIFGLRPKIQLNAGVVLRFWEPEQVQSYKVAPRQTAAIKSVHIYRGCCAPPAASALPSTSGKDY